MAKPKALILEDSPTQANIIAKLIAAQGWETVHCLSAKEAVEVLKTTEVQALFLDVFVGVHNTISLIPQFRRMAPRAQLIVMTAGSSTESIDGTLRSARVAKADFVLRKPFGEAHIKDIMRGIRVDGSGDTRRKHVLIVDDSSTVRAFVRSTMNVGYRVSMAESMEDAFQNTDIAYVDMVLCDIFMPGMGGLDGMRHIQKVWPQVKIIAMSAGVENFVSGEDALDAARNLGVNAQIKKPFSPDVLLEVVDLVLEDAQFVD